MSPVNISIRCDGMPACNDVFDRESARDNSRERRTKHGEETHGFPRLGTSFRTIGDDVNNDMCKAVSSSQIATCEILPAFLDGPEQEQKKLLIKDVFSHSGVSASSVHARFGTACDISALDQGVRANGVREVFSAIDLAMEMDAPLIVLHASAEPIPSEQRQQRFDQAMKSLLQIGERCEQNAKQIAVELLPRSCLGNTVDELLMLLDGLGKETFGVCLDVNHFMDRYNTIPEDVQKLGKRLIALHISDYDGIDEKHWLPGKGVIDWPALMRSLRNIDYNGPFTYECDIDGDTSADRVEILEENFFWMSRLLAPSRATEQ